MAHPAPTNSTLPPSIKIDRGLPLPRGHNAGGGMRLYPFPDMEIGDSFFVPKDKANSVRATAVKFGKDNSCRFVTRAVVDGIRVWRAE